MPKDIERKLKQEAKKKGFKPGSERFNRYVYGTLAKIEKMTSKSKKKGKRKKRKRK